MDRIEDSPLLIKIKEKLGVLGDAAYEIRVSITPQAENYESENGKKSYVKWLCWEINDNNETTLFQSELAIVHGHLIEAVIEADLMKFFPGKLITIDNEIYFEE